MHVKREIHAPAGCTAVTHELSNLILLAFTGAEIILLKNIFSSGVYT